MSLIKILTASSIVTVITFSNATSQNNANQLSTDYSANPAWIKMMDDPNTNYFEALNAFNAYWKNRIKPETEEDEKFEEVSSEEMRKLEQYISTLTPQQKNEYDYMVYQCKRFKNWKFEVFPFVQEDGRILSIEERQKIYEQQLKEMRR